MRGKSTKSQAPKRGVLLLTHEFGKMGSHWRRAESFTELTFAAKRGTDGNHSWHRVRPQAGRYSPNGVRAKSRLRLPAESMGVARGPSGREA
jgi:hypothetical protein